MALIFRTAGFYTKDHLIYVSALNGLFASLQIHPPLLAPLRRLGKRGEELAETNLVAGLRTWRARFSINYDIICLKPVKSVKQPKIASYVMLKRLPRIPSYDKDKRRWDHRSKCIPTLNNGAHRPKSGLERPYYTTTIKADYIRRLHFMARSTDKYYFIPMLLCSKELMCAKKERLLECSVILPMYRILWGRYWQQLIPTSLELVGGSSSSSLIGPENRFTDF